MKLIITDIKDFNIPIQEEHKIISPQGDIRNCIGCFGCWVKTPGKCVIHDGYEETGIDMSKCTEMILISECCYGSVSPFVKAVQDRALSYIHPDFVIRKGEMHHKRRYENVISISAYFYGDNITETEKETARNIIEANADNYCGLVKNVQFYKTVKELEDITL
ncbi:MAG: flavodoxin family protein [Candidatus Pseudoruminococcus sp.]|uniref:flavodoxin family protein n=1 Tax=Candidatus Pseudoruminococcus sp. TaxID=3101048 RepID=UPI002A76785E|nr:flavodoxin family protein [Ruminococcus sp.]MDY2782483.1 flavodoxin family protein [Candidatus Pseudoruminococcus sp.]